MYTIELSKIATKLERKVEIEYDPIFMKWIVSIPNVLVKDKYLRQNIHGVGFTIEDSSYDFIRKVRGLELENYITNKVIEVV